MTGDSSGLSTRTHSQPVYTKSTVQNSTTIYPNEDHCGNSQVVCPKQDLVFSSARARSGLNFSRATNENGRQDCVEHCDHHQYCSDCCKYHGYSVVLYKFRRPEYFLFPIHWVALLSDWIWPSAVLHTVSVAVTIKLVTLCHNYYYYNSEPFNSSTHRLPSKKEKEIGNKSSTTNHHPTRNQSVRLSAIVLFYYVCVRRLGLVLCSLSPLPTHVLGLCGLFLGQLCILKLDHSFVQQTLLCSQHEKTGTKIRSSDPSVSSRRFASSTTSLEERRTGISGGTGRAHDPRSEKTLENICPITCVESRAILSPGVASRPPVLNPKGTSNKPFPPLTITISDNSDLPSGSSDITTVITNTSSSSSYTWDTNDGDDKIYGGCCDPDQGIRNDGIECIGLVHKSDSSSCLLTVEPLSPTSSSIISSLTPNVIILPSSSNCSGKGGDGGDGTSSGTSTPPNRLFRSGSHCCISSNELLGLPVERMRRTSLPAALPAQRPIAHHVSQSQSI